MTQVSRNLYSSCTCHVVFISSYDTGEYLYKLRKDVELFSMELVSLSILDLLSSTERTVAYMTRDIFPTHLTIDNIPCVWKSKNYVTRAI